MVFPVLAEEVIVGISVVLLLYVGYSSEKNGSRYRLETFFPTAGGNRGTPRARTQL